MTQSPQTLVSGQQSLDQLSPTHFDYVIVGGGIVGISTALQLQQQYPSKRILVIEKETQLALHQTGHNSGVVHAGVYYPPDSLKAKFCRQGLKDTLAFCLQNDIPFEQCGKLIVATDELERQRLLGLYERCQENNVKVDWLDAAELRREEPNVVGLAAIRVADTAITDYPRLTRVMAQQYESLGGRLLCASEVIDLNEGRDQVDLSLRVDRVDKVRIRADFLIVCAGLMADRMARMMDIEIDFQIIPFRGEYYQLPHHLNGLVKHLIYPVPDPQLPFLGVHLTRMIDGSITVGPNAVQGLKREGYGKINVSLRDCWELLRFPGFWRLLSKNFATGAREWKNSLCKRGYLNLVNKYCPSVELRHLQSYPAGIRAQAVLADGSLVHDFLFARSRRSLHVCNAPSPAATSAFPIGGYILQQVVDAQSSLEN